MTTVFLAPIGNGQQWFTNTGIILAGGKINTYAAGTTTPTVTYTDITATVPNANPIILDSTGRYAQEIWLLSGVSYKFVVTDSNNNIIGTYDNLYGIGSVGSAFTNPMTTAGDMIDGGASGVPQRLAIGTSGQILTVSGGAPTWATASGFTNPMTTAGDLIDGGVAGAAQRLAIGTSGQVLTVSGGAPAWETSTPLVDLLYSVGVNGTANSSPITQPVCGASPINTPSWLRSISTPGGGGMFADGQMTFNAVNAILRFTVELFIGPTGSGPTITDVEAHTNVSGGGGNIFNNELGTKLTYAVSSVTGKSTYTFEWCYQVQAITDTLTFGYQINWTGSGVVGYLSQLKGMRLL